MLLRNYRQTLEFLLVFSLFFLSNILAFAYAFWLVPPLVLLVSLFWVLLTLLGVWILYRRNLFPSFLENLRRNWIVFPFLLFSGISIFWSVVWQISFYRWIALFCTILTGGYLGLQYDLKEILKLLSVFGVYILLLSSIFVFVFPDIGIMNYYSIQGAWQGLYWHKNHMGLIATFINLLFLLNMINSWQTGGKDLYLWSGLYVFSLLFIYQSDSVAAYFTTILLHGLVVAAFFLLKFKDRIHRFHYLVFLAALLFGALLLFLNLDQVLAVFNRNTTLTGRVPMWAYLFKTYLSQRPFLGYGFNAFWYVKTHQVSMQLAAGYPDPIIIADNGFIDILINIGYIGLFFFLPFYLVVWWRSIQYATKARDLTDVFPVILMSYTFLANLSWSLIFENEGFFMLLMAAVLFCMSAHPLTDRSAR